MKSMYKIDKREKGGWLKKSYIRKLPLVMYKIDGGGGVQKLFILTDPKHAHYHCY